MAGSEASGAAAPARLDRSAARRREGGRRPAPSGATATVPDPAAPARRRPSPANTGHGAGRRSGAATGAGLAAPGRAAGRGSGRAADSNPARPAAARGAGGRRRRRVLARQQQRERVLVGERVALPAHAEVQAAVTARDGAERRAGARPSCPPGRRPTASGRWVTRRRPQRTLTTAPRPGDRPGVHHDPAARRPDRRAGRRGEVEPAVRAPGERRRAGVGEGARHVAGDRPQPSLGHGGGGSRRRCQGGGPRDRAAAATGRAVGSEMARTARNLRPEWPGPPGCACLGAELVQSRCGSAAGRAGSRPPRRHFSATAL